MTVFLACWFNICFMWFLLSGKFTLYFLMFYLILPLFWTSIDLQKVMHLAPENLCSFVCGLPNIYLHILANSFATPCPRNIKHMNRDKGLLWFCADVMHLISSIILSTFPNPSHTSYLNSNPLSALSPIPPETYHQINLSLSVMNIIQYLIVF